MARDILDSLPSTRRSFLTAFGSAPTPNPEDTDVEGEDSDNGDNDNNDDDDDLSLWVKAVSCSLVLGAIIALFYGALQVSNRVTVSTFDFGFDEFAEPDANLLGKLPSIEPKALLSIFQTPKFAKIQYSRSLRKIPFAELPTEFPKQSSTLWKMVKQVADNLEDHAPGVLTLLADHDNDETREELALVVGKAIADLAFENPCPIIEISAKELSHESFEYVRTAFTELLLKRSHYIVIIHDLHLLDSHAALMIYPFIDEVRAPCKRCVFIFTMTATRPSAKKAKKLQLEIGRAHV